MPSESKKINPYDVVDVWIERKPETCDLPNLARKLSGDNNNNNCDFVTSFFFIIIFNLDNFFITKTN